MTEITLSSEIDVRLIRHMASDQAVVDAARVSTLGDKAIDTEESRGLINYLMRDRHGSPFEHAVFTFFVSAPIFVWREHMRHRIASYNEESSRYKKLEPRFYVPFAGRNLQQIGKPGAYRFERGTREQEVAVFVETQKQAQSAYDSYERLLGLGVAREVARNVLPVNTYSTAYVTMNARALMNFLGLRTEWREYAVFKSFPLKEISMVADSYEEAFRELMPHTYWAWDVNGRVAP